MMLQYTFEDLDNAGRIERAVEAVLEDGLRTADIFEKGTKLVSTREMGDAIVTKLN